MYDMVGADLSFIGTAVGQIEEFCNENGIDNSLVYSVSAETLSNKIMEIKSNSQNFIIKNKEKYTWKYRAESLIKFMTIDIIGD